MRTLNNTTKLLNQKQISTQHLLFHRSAVVLSLENGAYPQNMPRVFCHNDSVLLNLLRVWILRKVFPLKICACLCCLIKIAFFILFYKRLCTFTKQCRTMQFKSRKQRESSDERKAGRVCCLIKISVFLTFCVLLSSNTEPSSLNHESSGEFRVQFCFLFFNLLCTFIKQRRTNQFKSRKQPRVQTRETHEGGVGVDEN